MKTIAIVGAGFSGTLLAIHLLRQRAELRVLLFERRASFGQGLAFGTHETRHVLNVPAGRMSAFAGKPADFVDWLTRRYDERIDPNEFLPRAEFGSYLSDLLQRAMQTDGGRRLLLVNDEVVGVADDGPVREVHTALGLRYPVDAVVLALGNLAPPVPAALPVPLLRHPDYIPEPWSHDWIDGLTGRERIVVLGTGLTAIDVVLSLIERRHEGLVTLLSRRGLLPQAHEILPAVAVPTVFPRPLRLSRMLRRFRHAAAHGDWRGLIDGLRPQTQELWQRLSETERARFLRHLRPWWDIHRHRMAPQVAERVRAWRSRGRLIVAGGHLQSIVREKERFKITYRRRHLGDEAVALADRLVNATGVGSDLANSRIALVRNLLKTNRMSLDSLGLGPRIAADNTLLDAQDQASDWIFGLGPITRSRYWEIAAVPDIRLQVEQLVARLLSKPSISATRARRPPLYSTNR